MLSIVRQNPIVRTAAGVLLIAAVYIYFLIFAQFGFLKLVESAGVHAWQMQFLMALMGISGVLASLGAAKRCDRQSARRLIQAGLIACATTAGLALVMEGFLARCVVSILIGASAGLLTVSLSASYPFLWGARRFGLAAGLGTGLAYAICNIPAVFAASPARQAVIAALACGVGFLMLPFHGESSELDSDRPVEPESKGDHWSFVAVVAAFFGLIWLDSCGFYVLQHTPALNRFGWANSVLQWQNAGIQLVAAAAAGFWLDRRGLAGIPIVACVLLIAAAVCVMHGDENAAAATHWLYAAGVSIYSAALTFAPAASCGGDLSVAARRAGALFAVAGWGGSALGVGIAQNMHAIPMWLVIAAGAMVVASTLVQMILPKVRTADTRSFFRVGKKLRG